MENKVLTGYASIDKPSRKFYKEGIDEIILEGADKKMYDFMKEKNVGHSSDPAYSYFGETRTFEYFDQKVEEYAKALKRYGLNKGDTITLCLPNIPDTAIYFYACNRIGVTPYLIDPRCTPKRVKECMELSNSKLLISVLDVMGKVVIPNVIPSDNIVVVSPHNDFIKLKTGKEATAVKMIYTLKENLYKFENLLKKDKKVIMQRDFTKGLGKYGNLTDSEYDPEIPASIVNTSGTTGTPKGAMETNKGYNITVNQIYHVAPHIGRGMTYFGYIPFFSLYGSAVGMHTALSRGIIMDLIPKIDAHKFDEIFMNKKPNIVIGVPRLFEMFPDSKFINGQDLSFGELLVMGGDKISPYKLDKINDTLLKNNCKQKITYGYGATEAMMISTTTDKEESHERGGCGTLYPGVTVRITDRNTLKEMPYNEEGEIYVNTPTMFKGYVGNEKETSDSMFIDSKTGLKYYKTGDKGYMTDSGILYHTGRFKRLMKRPDGHQVSSVPIEDALNSCEDVRDCAVVGITNSYQDQGVIPTAFIQLNGDTANKETLKKVILQSKEKLPGEREMAMAYTLVDHIPYTVNGKIDFKLLEKVKFENIDFVALDDPLFDGYFIKGENIEYFNINQPNLLRIKKK